jgi:hypothetical protein
MPRVSGTMRCGASRLLPASGSADASSVSVPSGATCFTPDSETRTDWGVAARLASLSCTRPSFSRRVATRYSAVRLANSGA